MDTFRQDLLYALRILRKERAYSAAVVLTLAVCLGANTAIFTVVRSVLFRPLPYPQPERLISSLRQLPGRGHRTRRHIGAELCGPPGDDRRLLIRCTLSMGRLQGGRRRPGRGRVGDERDAVILRRARRHGRAWTSLHRDGRHSRQEQGRARELHLCRPAARRCGRHRRPTAAAERRGSRRRRRPAGELLLLEPRGPRVRAAGVRACGLWRRPAPQPGPRAIAAARSGSHARTRAVACRRPERGRNRSRRPAEGRHHSRRLCLEAAAARRRSRPQRARGAADALGRRGVRDADRRREHHEPRARPHQRPHQGTGDPQRDRRRKLSSRQTAHYRSDHPDGGRRLAWRAARVSQPGCARVDRLHRPATCERNPRRRRRHRPHARARPPPGDRRGGRTGAAAGPRESQRDPPRRRTIWHRRPHVRIHPALAGGRAGRARLRAHRRRRVAVRELPAAAGRRSGLRPGAPPDRPGQPAPIALSRRCGAAVVCCSSPRTRARAAGRRISGHQQLPAVQLGREQQRDHSRGLRHRSRGTPSSRRTSSTCRRDTSKP